MKTLAAKISPTVSAAKPSVLRQKSNTPAIAPPKTLFVPSNGRVQPKLSSAFSWMRSKNLVQKKADAALVRPGKQAIIQPKAKPVSVHTSKSIQPKLKPVQLQIKQPVQAKLEIGPPNDHYEHEADSIAQQVVNMPAPVTTFSVKTGVETQPVQRKTEPGLSHQTASSFHDNSPALHISPLSHSITMLSSNPARAGPQTTAIDVESRLNNSSGRGSPLSQDVKDFFEPRFRADFSKVRIHTDQEAVSMNNRLASIAFAHGSDIYFNANQYNFSSKEGKILIAHELTHVLQQGGAARRKIGNISPAPISIQRSVVGEVLDWFADKANIIPGFRMFTIVLGINPINGSKVERSGANIIRAAIEFIPGGGLITQALDNYGIFEKAGAWIENEFAQLGMVGSLFKKALGDFVDDLGWSDLLPWNWGDVWDRAKKIFTVPIGKLIDFAKGLLIGFIKIIKDAILRPIAKLAEGTRGYDLLKALLGEDPITGDKVPQTADTLIGGFMKLIGQEEIWENIKKANAIPRAWAWFKNAMSSLVALMRQIPGRFISAFTSLELMDIVVLPRAFIKVGKVFLGIVGDFLSWGLNTIWDLLQIIFEVVAPAAMPYIAKAKAAFRKILKDPIGFVGNLVRAGKMGFELFRTNFVKHLTASLINWLVGPLASAGVYIPKSFTLIEIIKLVLSVLGLTWQNIRSKLVKIIPEPVLQVLEKTAGILVTLVTEGPAAAWQQIIAELTELKDKLISQVIEMVTTEVVKAAVIKLLSFLNPAGAFIQAIIAIYKTITFFIEKIKQIAAVVASFIDSISDIANGVLDKAAKNVEKTMANLLTLVISFLANFIGLGGIPDKIVGIVKKIRQPVDKGLDKIVAWLGNLLKSIKQKITEWWKMRKSLKTPEGENHTLYFEGERTSAKLMVASDATEVKEFIKKKRPEAEKDNGKMLAINNILPLITKIESLEKLPENKQQAKQSEFTDAFNLIGTYLVILLSADGSWGTKENPLPLEYPKRRAAAYPAIYLGPKSNARIPQTLLAGNQISQIEALLSKKELAAWTSRGERIIRFDATVQEDLPEGEDKIGLSTVYQIEVGKVIKYEPGSSTPGGGKLKGKLERYGYKFGSEANDADHVVEIQLGGKDELGNLWPLPRGENRSSGSLIKNIQVKKPDKTDILLKDAYKQKKNSLWIIIVATKAI